MLRLANINDLNSIMKNKYIKHEIWKFLRNVSIITLIAIITIFITMLLNKDGAFIIIITWPFIAILPFIIILNLIILTLSLFKIKRNKKRKK